MRRFSTLLEFITLKTIEYGRLIIQLPIPKVVLDKNESFRKGLWFGLGVRSKGVSPLVIFKDETMNHDGYIKEVLPVALKFGNDMFGTDWTFQQDSAMAHIYAKS